MKKCLSLLFLFSISHITFSQTRFGIRGGLNIANQKEVLSGNGEYVEDRGSAFASFHIGGMGELQLNRHFFIQSGLLLSGKGANFKSLNTGYIAETKVRPYYLELPVLVIAKAKIANNKIGIYGGGGPLIAYGLFGKEKADGETFPLFDNARFQRFDFGVDITGGVEFSPGWQISFHFNPGISNILTETEEIPDHHEVKNKVFAVSVGYFLSRNKH